MKIIINGAGIAGTTLAYWLQVSGHEVLLIEELPKLRSGGYAIDFWGVGYDIAEKMGLLPRIKELGYHVKEMRYVNRQGHKSGGFPVYNFFRVANGRYTERGAHLAATIYGSLNGNVETILGDPWRASRMKVIVCGRFDHALSRKADLIVGADGLHSRGSPAPCSGLKKSSSPLGYHIAAFDGQRLSPAR